MTALFIILILIGIFFLSYSWFLFCSKPNEELKSLQLAKLKQPLLPFLVLGIISCLAIYSIIPDQNDAIFSSSIWLPITVFGSGLILLKLMSRFSSNRWQLLFLFIFSLINTFMLPADFVLTNGLIPPFAERILLAFSWCLFAFFYNILNGADGVLNIQSLSISIGTMLMFAIGIMPALYGYYACAFIALFVAYNFFARYPASLPLNTTECRLVGFLLGWLCILATVEGNASCILILNMYYFYELITASIKKLSFQKQFKKLTNNTFYGQLAASGIPPKNICELIGKINLIMIVLAGFQVYSPNMYSMVIISFFMVFWLISRATSTDKSRNHLLLTGSLLASLNKNREKTPKDK